MTPDPQGHARGSAPLTGREPLFIVWNQGSGSRDAEVIRSTIRRVLDEAGRTYELIAVDDGRKLAAVARRAVETARQRGGVVVACGGDGTLNAVAQAVLGSGVPFGIVPQGTFNYFGRAYGIPQDTEIATRGLLNAHVEPVQVGMLNNRIFLVNASLGLYPQLLEDREAYKRRYGRSRLVALWSCIVTLLRRGHRRLAIQLDSAEVQRVMRTPTLVVGNNALQLRQIGIPEADDIERGKLVAMTPRPVGTLALYGLLLRGLLSRLGEAENVISFPFERMTVQLGRRLRRHDIKVAMDGEVCWMRAPLEFRVSPQALMLLVPAEEHRVEAA
ncbi:diacylglycerol/lipid kinase family protein [Bordetella genomosp. 13]|uniref:Diacylglycerol kinase n=1 Tax=Bordetella genomosp. 13 TaxID=463040 RepID=A0A1W6ZFE5_9BORD|nr:diacylglycerol kinase family protein [Bordetella genomosp. 13]ARP95975.1 diacylglycerol kinase [Bordetella genomosp. 13]